jgi:hypothetical protein
MYVCTFVCMHVFYGAADWTQGLGNVRQYSTTGLGFKPSIFILN